MSNIEAVLERVAERRPKLIDLSLDRVFAVLERLGNPHKAMPPVFHVAGTNGKGSTIAYLRSVLEAAGHTLHVYTSPHLVRFNERMVVAGREIDDQTLIDALLAVDAAAGDSKLTYFETTTCAAFVAFAAMHADFAVIEVGLGGRLDATNVFDTPLTTIITPVDLDHQLFLGDTVEAIAAEKAGIFRRGVPAIIGAQSASAMGVLTDIADRQGARPFVFGQDWQVYGEHGRMIYQDGDGLADLDLPSLIGAHQLENAGLAIAALRASGIILGNETLSRGIAKAVWPARMQRLMSGPLVDRAETAFGPDNAELWLDGGHNPHAGRVIAQAIASMNDTRPRPLVMIAGMQDNKDAAGYFENFDGLAAEVLTVSSGQDAAMPAPALAAAATAAGLKATPMESVDAAMSRLCADHKKEPPRILIGGSLYLAGEILRDHS